MRLNIFSYLYYPSKFFCELSIYILCLFVIVVYFWSVNSYWAIMTGLIKKKSGKILYQIANSVYSRE